MSLPPRIKLQRAKTMPTGYLLGRTSGGQGDVELLGPQQLRSLGIAHQTELLQRTTNAGFGFFIEGLMLAGETLGSAVFPFDVTFTDGNVDTTVTSLTPATAGAVLKLNSVDAAHIPYNVGSITFSAAGTVGVVTWVSGSFVLLAGRAITLVAPAAADATLASVTGIVTGKK